MERNWVLTFVVYFAVFSLIVIVGMVSVRLITHQTDTAPTVTPSLASSSAPEELPKITPEETKQNANAQNPVPPTPTKPFSFVVLADAEDYGVPSGHNAILEHMLASGAAQKPTFAIFSGDLITMPDTLPSRITNLLALLNRHYPTYYIAFGKHDIECGNQCVDVWNKLFFHIKNPTKKDRILYHSFDHENTHFVLLSSDYPLKHGVDDAQLAWLDDDLTKTDKENIIVVSHVPPINFYKESTETCHDMTCDEARRMRLQNILAKHHVDLVLSGHEHTFDHRIVDNVVYILAGNVGNGKRYKNTLWQSSFLYITIDGPHITLKLLDENGNALQQKPIK
ncbi:MAG: metallophosphoesterase [Parcubacteria group bacterium]|jgi:hypothetical protein